MSIALTILIRNTHLNQPKYQDRHGQGINGISVKNNPLGPV